MSMMCADEQAVFDAGLGELVGIGRKRRQQAELQRTGVGEARQGSGQRECE